ncbi:Glycosyl transferase family 8 [Popillia japonica]|uniref:glycogenin glucosyltransferase n=1 Tax=Popillia japonica TaxID=7064 RepID=A0AAW1NHZ2_POPJA
MSGFAWVTLATNDSYSLGALVLAHSLKQAGTAHQLAVLVTPGVTNVMRKNLNDVFNVVEEVNLFDSKDEANLRLLKRPELGVTFTKLHCWRLTQFEKCVFLDADVLVLVNADELFERDEFSAAPDVGWPDCFNSGVFVYRPSMETYNKLVDFALQKGSFDGGDQGLLNAYFSDWAHKDISKHLPFIYNMCSTACYSYLPAFKYYGGNVKIVHFIGPAKPWLQYFDTESRIVQPSPDLQHLQEVLQKWWDIFCSLIHPKLTPDMSGLAGAFAQFTLGVKRTAAQDAFENHLRRQAWEVGNIDYMGRDSFDNIWSKICQTLSVTQLESVKDGAVFSSENQQVPELLQEGSTAVEAAAEAAAAPAPDQPIETPPLLEQVRTEVPESSPAAVGSELTAVPVVPIEPLPQAVPPTDVKIEEVAVVPTNNTQPLSEIAPDERIPKPDVVPDPEPLKEVQQQPIIPEERSAETAVESPVLTETAVKDEEEVPAPQKIADVSETVKEAIAPSEVTTSDSQAPTVPDEPSEAVVPPSEPTPVKEVAPPPPPSQSEPVKEITSPVTEAELSVKELPSPPPQTEPVKEIASSQLVAAEVDKQFVSSETKPTEEVVSSPISVPEPVEGAISPEPEQVKEVLPPKPEPKPEPEPVLEEAIVQTTTASKPEPAPIREVLPPEPVKEAAPPPSTEEAKPKPTKREAKTPKLPDSSKLAKTTPTKVETTSESPKAETPPASPKTEEVPPESPKAEQTISASPKPEDIPEAEPSAEVPKSDTKPKEVRKVKKKVKKVPKPEGDASSSEGASKK